MKGDRVPCWPTTASSGWRSTSPLARAGLVAVPINFRLLAPEIAYIAEHSEARAVIVQDEPRRPRRGASAPICRSPRQLLDPLRRRQRRAGWQGYEALIAAAGRRRAARCACRRGHLFALMYTSGTTGRPRRDPQPRRQRLLDAVTALDIGFSRDDTGLLVMPMCHANSLNFGLTFMYLGATVIVDDRKSFDPGGAAGDAGARCASTFTSLVPTHYIMMLALPDAVKARYDVSSGRQASDLLGAGAQGHQARHPVALPRTRSLFELYGATETGWVTLLRPEQQIDRLGRSDANGPVRRIRIRPRWPEVPDGEVGELFSRTSYVFDGYWKNPEKTAEAFRGEWCSVGDMARRDADGYIHLVDRKSNMIISGGEIIYPSEVEACSAPSRRSRMSR